MKKLLTWMWLFQKRILKKPMFQITLLLIPILLFLLFSFHQSSDSFVKVALCPSKDSFSKSFTNELSDSSNQVISFYICQDENQLRQDVIKGKAECGYIFPDNIEERMLKYEKEKKDVILTAIVKEESLSTKVVNEIIYGRLFSGTSYQILDNFISDKYPDKIASPGAREQLHELFSQYHKEQLMFSFEYADGQKNDLLNTDNSNYYMLPVRGLLAVLIMVSALGGILMLNNDDLKGTWNFISLSQRPVFNYFYIFMSILPIALCSIIAVFLTGISTSILNEILLMLLYILLLTGFCNLLKTIIKNIYVLCSLIPIAVLLSLIICPVFIDLGSIMPQIKYIRLLLPANYYLDAIYSSSMQIKMFIIAFIISAAGIISDKFCNQ